MDPVLPKEAAGRVCPVNFLQFEFEENGKQYRTINTYRSAVSTTLGTCPVRGAPVGQDPLVCRFMKGLLRLKPPKTQLFPNWDLVTVLDRLMSWEDIKQLSLLQLLKKTAFLVAIVCYKRPADLCNMQIVRGYWDLNHWALVRQSNINRSHQLGSSRS